MIDREAAWAAVMDQLPAGCHVGPPSYDPGRHRWEIVARSPKPPGRQSRPAYVVGEGPDEVAALEDLAARLDGSTA
jgi:hypothetical protein